VVCGEEGLEEVEEDEDIHLIFGGVGKLRMEDSHGGPVRNGKRCMHLCV
jgi:hypothetical protein